MDQILFANYKEWLIRQGYGVAVASTYVSKLRSFLNQLNSNEYTALSKIENILNEASNNKFYMQGVLQGLDLAISRAFTDPECSISKGLKNDGRSSFRKFVEYVNLQLFAPVPTVTSSPISTPPVIAPRVGIIPHKMPKMTYAMMGWQEITQKAFYKTFKNRLVSQGRESGTKIWLSIRLVNYILGKQWFEEWSRAIFNRTKVLIDSNGKSINLSSVGKVVLRPNSKGFDVDVILIGNNNQVPIFTKTKTENIIPFSVKQEADISIEHIKAMDTTLREHSSELVELNKLSRLLKKAPRNIKGDNNLYQWVKVNYPNINEDINKSHLIQEMTIIMDDTEYELMHRSENSGKGAR